MVTGFYISMDPPGTLGTGLCISASVLPKDDLLIRHDVKGEWPSFGVMDTIYLDNAREFRGESLFRSCSEYGINIAWRPVARPEWGGHIERLIGTYVREIHNLPGTTFSNTKERKDYDSTGKACLTLGELEKWLVTFTVEVYHKRIHSSLGKSPFQKYKEGIFGENGTPGIGIPPKVHDPIRLKLDFLPTLDRTIQDYGVLIDHIYYYHDVLRRWINSTDPGSGKSRVKRKFVFKRDPRDISIIYFLDPDLKDYFMVPYRNITYPSMSIWEYNEIVKELNKEKKTNIQEEDIFAGYEKLKRIEIEAVDKTRLTKQVNMKAFKREEARRKRGMDKKEINNQVISTFTSEDLDDEKPEPFENIDF
jgi:putative transposase